MWVIGVIDSWNTGVVAIVGGLILLMTINAQIAGMAEPVVLNDFYCCSPREYFETATLELRWQVKTVPLGGEQIQVLYADPCVLHSIVRYPVDLAGIYEIYIGLYVPNGGLPSAKLAQIRCVLLTSS